MKTEITPLLIITKLEQFDYRRRDGAGRGHARRFLCCCCWRSICCNGGAAGYQRASLIMGDATTLFRATRREPYRRATAEPPWVRWLLIAVALLFLGLFLVVPLVSVFAEGVAQGPRFLFPHVSRPADAERHPTDVHRRRHFRAAELRLRRGGGVGDRQIRFPRQKHADHAD